LSDGETPGSTIENRITKAITFGTATSKLENGKKYTINLILGLKDVKFDADVNDTWEDAGSADAYLPNNMPAFAAYTTGSNLKLGISGDKDTYTFAVTGLKGGETVSASAITDPVKSTTPDPTIGSSVGATDNKANSSGLAFVQIGLTPWTQVKNSSTTENITVTGAESSKKVTLDITQYAVKLGLQEPETKTSASSYTYRIAATGTWYDDPSDGSGLKSIRLWVDGVEQTGEQLIIDTSSDSPGSGKYRINTAGAAPILYCGTPPAAGTVITLTIKTGDVAPETVTFTVTD
jgi:hypothetical protein